MFNKKPKEKKLTELLNEALANELQVSLQYMWQHIQAVGINAAVVTPIFKKIAINEMQHSEMIAERLNYLGVEPTIKPNKIEIGTTLQDMLQKDTQDEENAIKLYKEIIEKATLDKDYATRILFEKILSDEESHHDQFTNLLEK